jgi:hypothetical protein
VITVEKKKKRSRVIIIEKRNTTVIDNVIQMIENIIGNLKNTLLGSDEYLMKTKDEEVELNIRSG